ncbi:MAG: hypothetical protein ACRDRO_00085 [Pseudonocardiaceae bacterium]
MTQVTEVSVEGRLVGLEAGHPAVLDALDEFFTDLKSVPELRAAEQDAVGSGGKGVLAELIVGLEGTGSIAAFVRLWLERDRHRSLTVSVTEQETGRVIQIEGKSISIETLTEALSAAAHQRSEKNEKKAPGRTAT